MGNSKIKVASSRSGNLFEEEKWGEKRSTLQKQPSCQRSVVIRTFITSDFMTGIPATPGNEIPVEVVLKTVTEIKKIPGISRIMYDLTSKPPGTTEWE